MENIALLIILILAGVFTFLIVSGIGSESNQVESKKNDENKICDKLFFEQLKEKAAKEIASGRITKETADSIWMLGMRCRYVNDELSAQCFELLAKNGYTGAAGIFRQILEYNPRLQKVHYKSMLEKARTGNINAMFIVYRMLREGRGTLKNFEEASSWLMKAAELGFVKAMVELADEYMAGGLLSVNPIEALSWYMSSKSVGDINCDTQITQLEKLLPVEAQIAAQNRAKQIIQAIKSGRAVPGIDSPSAPSSPPLSKPASPPRGSGSGAIVSGSGHVVTAHHVIKSVSYIEVVTPTGTHPAKVLFADAANDLAILKVDQSFSRHLSILNSRSIRLGAKVSTIGFPNIGLQGHSPKATEGVISSDLGFQNDVRMWQVSVPIQPGNSGGPLLDEAGYVVGVVVASLSLNAVKITGAVPQNVNYAIKSAYLEPMLGGCQVDMIQTAVAEPRRLEDIMESARQASVLILTY